MPMKEIDLVQRASFGNLSRCFKKTERVDRVHRGHVSPILEDIKLVSRILAKFCGCYQGIDLLYFWVNMWMFSCQSIPWLSDDDSCVIQ